MVIVLRALATQPLTPIADKTIMPPTGPPSRISRAVTGSCSRPHTSSGQHRALNLPIVDVPAHARQLVDRYQQVGDPDPAAQLVARAVAWPRPPPQTGVARPRLHRDKPKLQAHSAGVCGRLSNSGPFSDVASGPPRAHLRHASLITTRCELVGVLAAKYPRNSS